MPATSMGMNISSIGIQLVQSGSATGQRGTGSGTQGQVSDERVAASASPQAPLPSGVGENVDKTA